MAEPVLTTAALVAACVYAPMAGPIGNWADRGIVTGVKRLAGVLAGTQTPENHDVLKATHGALVQSLQVMAQLCITAIQSPADQYSLSAFTKALRDSTLNEFHFQGDNLPLDRLNELIDKIYQETPDPAGALTELVIGDVEGVMKQKLAANLRKVFHDGHLGKRGWAQTFQLFFSETVKEKKRVFRIIAFERLNEIVAFSESQNAELARVHRALSEFSQSTAAQLDRIEQFVTAGLALLNQRQPATMEGHPRFAQVEAEVTKAIERDPTLAGGDIVKQVVNLIASRENALKELAAIPPVDNRVRSYQATAEEALASNDSAKALSALHDARAAIDERRELDARLSAKYAAAQAELFIGTGKWREADAIWSEAEALLQPFDADAAEDVQKLAAKRLFEYADSFVDGDALFRSFQRCSELIDKVDVDEDGVKWAKRAIFSSYILTTAGSLDESMLSQRYIDLAFNGFVSALKLINQDVNYEEWLQGICGLGTLYALKAERVRANGANSNAYVIAKNAGDTFEIALSSLKEDSKPEERARIACCIGHARLIQGDAAPTQEEGVRLFTESMRALQYADSLVKERDQPSTWATIQMHAGCTLMEASKWVEQDIRAKLAFDAVTAIRASLRVYSEFKTPNDWAQAQCHLGAALMGICKRSEGEDWERIKAEGIEAFSAALRVWNQANFPYAYETVTENLEKLRVMKPAAMEA